MVRPCLRKKEKYIVTVVLSLIPSIFKALSPLIAKFLPFLPTLGNPHSIFCLCLTTLNISYKWNHRFVLFMSNMSFKIRPSRSMWWNCLPFYKLMPQPP